jgi:hypothetical protein
MPEISEAQRVSRYTRPVQSRARGAAGDRLLSGARAELGVILGRELPWETPAELRDQAPWSPPVPRSPHPSAPHTFATTPAFLERWGLNSLTDLPKLDRLRDDGLLSKVAVLARASTHDDERDLATGEDGGAAAL